MSGIVAELSDGLAQAVETVGPALVRVEGRRRLPASGVVWSADGVIVTAHHVVSRDEGIRIGLANGEVLDAALVGRDPTTDLAVLRVNGAEPSPATWADPDDLRVGHLVLAVGRPGQSAQSTLGIVSALGESWRTPAGGHVDRYLQTDVVMYPGFSGGPLVDVAGQVRGINTSALLRGISLALPTSTVRDVVAALLEHGRIRRGYLGIGGQPVRLPDNVAAELGQETGILLVSVEPDSPAGQGGLALGDTIVAFDGEKTHDLDDLLALLGGERVGKKTPIRILRGGELKQMTVTVGEKE